MEMRDKEAADCKSRVRGREYAVTVLVEKMDEGGFPKR
jgi:hypothetical protein